MTTSVIAALMLSAIAAEAKPEKIRYEPLSAEARELGRLDAFKTAARRDVTLELGSLKLRARVPASCGAYDVVPIEYELGGDAGPDRRVAIEAVAFEDEAKRKGRDLYDLAIPGNMKIRIEYLGSRTGVFEPSRVSRLALGSRHETFPPYRLEPFVRSGTVQRGNYLFFKFRITNVGDTILDPEGFGGWMATPQSLARGTDGKLAPKGGTINTFERCVDYVYPGESFEQWVHFGCLGQEYARCRTLPAGDYVIRYVACYRWNAEYDWGVNIWGGRPWCSLDVPITVAEAPANTPVEPKEVVLDADPDRMTRYVNSLEEFMTSLRVFERAEFNAPLKGTIHVQVAPWTKQLVLKLVGNTAGRIRTVAVPITVSSDKLAVRPCPENPFVVKRGGRTEPAFCTQEMVAMRTSSQLGPNPERHLRERLREQMACGVNLLCTTAGNWQVQEIFDPNAFVGDCMAETWKHYFDVIIPEAGMPVLGWGLFPPRTAQVPPLGSLYWGRKIDVPFVKSPYTYTGTPDIDVAHPNYPEAYAGVILWNYKRWGNLWCKTADGDVIIDTEDSWGWLRDDINNRFILGEHAIGGFRDWLKRRYGNIAAVNRAWGTSFAGFDAIDPQVNHGNEGKAYGTDLSSISPVYNNKANPFHDWTPAVEDWDVFRTELRCDVYEKVLKIVRNVIPGAQIGIRTEGAVIPVNVEADSPVAHLRHLRYVQRRQALVAEVLARRKVIKYHSDYTTIPYTQTEWRTLLRKLREQGMRGVYLPQFCTARDMVLNDSYGRDFSMNYNLAGPKRAIMMHVLQAAYPVWRIQYEEGQCPGVLWEDYMCDGFVSETQKRELRLFRERLNAAAVR